MRKIENRTYPFYVVRRCPRCGKSFDFLVRNLSQYRYYPPCPDCIGHKGRGIKKSIRDMEEELTKAERREAMFERHTQQTIIYRAMLRKHMGLHDTQEDGNGI